MPRAYGVNILNNATSQLDRIAGAPAPDRVRVDGRNVAQLLAFAAHYGALIQFYDLDNQPDGDWSAFFAADPAVAHALHAALDLAEIERALQQLLIEARAAHDHHGRLPPMKRVLSVLARLLGILDRSAIGPGDPATLVAHGTRHDRLDALAAPLRRLHRHLSGHSVESLFDPALYGNDPRWSDALADILDDVVTTLIGELRAGVAAAQAAVDAALGTTTHAPQAAIYNAFIALFAEARTVLNQFPQRLVEFYYSDVLKQQDLGPEPSQVFLTFTRTDGVSQASVPRDAQFLAGADADGQPINFAALNALEVTGASVEHLSVHRLTQTPIGPNGTATLPTGLLSGQVATIGDGGTLTEAFPLFGRIRPGVYGALTMQRASLGFCIASPVLLMAGGTRTVTVALSVSRRDRSALGAQAMASMVSSLDWLVEIVQANLDLHYSTGGGWVLVQGLTVSHQPSTGGEATAIFVIAFTLPPDAPAVEPLSAKPAADAPPPTLPADAFPDQPEQAAIIIGMKLEAARQPSAFALLSIVKFDAVTIDVTVAGLTQLTLTTPTGKVGNDQQFTPFGPQPVQHATLSIQAPELFAKPMTSMQVAIPWVGLPITSTGFQGYYQQYLLDGDGAVSPTPLFDNSSFRVGFRLNNPGPWQADETAQPYLFQTEAGASASSAPAAAAPVLQQSILTVPGVTPAPTPTYYNAATSALQLALVAPDYAFGNMLYTSNMMAAALAQSSAAHQHHGATKSDSAAAIAKLSTVNATAPDRSYWSKVTDAVHKTVSSLTGEALGAVQQAIGQSGAPPHAQMAWLQDLKTTLAGVATARFPLFGGMFGWLFGASKLLNKAVDVADALAGWVHEHAPSLGPQAAPTLDRSKQLLAAAGSIAAAHGATKGQAPPVARPNIAAAAQQGQARMQPAGLPNPPWLPMVSGLSVDYTASVHTVIEPDPAPVAATTTPLGLIARPDQRPVAAPVADGSPLDLKFWHVGPFGKFKTPAAALDDDGPDGVSLLPAITSEAALYIQLSRPVSQIALLFVLAAGEDGWWDDPPPLAWEEYRAGTWHLLQPLDDSTNGLKNSGIVTLVLTVPPGATKAPRIRVRALGDAQGAPTVQAVIANALVARWVGPGGATQLGMPLPSGTITKSAATLPGIGSIAQPMESFGGRPPATGAAFQMWMAERLRHKGYAIDVWDHARLALEAAPSLWQAAVVPATDEHTGLPRAGQVWIVAVPGPNTPNIADKTVPQVDLATLSSIGDALAGQMSEFAGLSVTNPTYLRLVVSAIVEFTEDDTGAFWRNRLNAELIDWLSPWPDPALGPRPSNYYTRRAVAEFIRHRAYVRGIVKFTITPEAPGVSTGYYYLTSAAAHRITPAPPHRHGRAAVSPQVTVA